MAITILRRAQLKDYSGLPLSTLYLRIKQGLFPKPVSLGGGRSVGWPTSEVEAVNAARIAGKSDGEIRQLVQILEASRAVFAA